MAIHFSEMALDGFDPTQEASPSWRICRVDKHLGRLEVAQRDGLFDPDSDRVAA